MNSNSNQFKNPLIRDGVSQRQRQIASSSLSPDFVKLDERELADALVFAYQLSQNINYYGRDGKQSGNWKEFLTSSTPVQIALISKTRSQTIKDQYDQKLQDFLEKPSKTTLKAILELWKTHILGQIWQWYQDLESYTPLKAVIQGLIKTNLLEPLMRMQGFERELQDPSISAQPLKLDDFLRSFWSGSPAIPSYRGILKSDRATQRDELDAIFQRLFQTYRQIIQDAPKYLQSSLSDRQDHAPHLALYFAFWEVIKPAREDLNLMTQRHLDFFYQRVLNLQERPAEPDHAHLLFELAKLPNLDEFKLPLGTRFKAGKDALGKDLFYKLDEDIVVHKTKIASLRGLFLDKTDCQIRGLYTSAIANSFDGKGGAFPKDQLIPSWLPFGNTSRDAAMLGCAIASDVLLLKEGNRTITLTLTLQDTIPELTPHLKDLNSSELQTLFKVKVSSKEKDWIEAQLLSAACAPLPGLSNLKYQLTLAITLTADQPPLLPYLNPLPGAVLPTTQPVLLLLLNPDNIYTEAKLASYHFLQAFQLSDLQIQTSVDQVRDLVLQNDLSVLDANKPFQPFGPQPKAGSHLYIGSQEVFQKHLIELAIEFNLEQPPPKNWLEIYKAYDSAMDASNPNNVQLNSKFQPGTLSIQALRDREWSPVVPSSLFSDSEISLTSSLTTLKLDNAIAAQPIEPWTNQSQNSFLRLQLLVEQGTRSDFLHNEYPTVLARQMVAVATNPPGAPAHKRGAVIGAYYQQGDTIIKATGTTVDDTNEPIIPKEPYLPVVTSLSLSYRAIAQRQDCTLFLLFPFNGFLELASNTDPFLIPLTDASSLFEGELLIGLQDLDPPTALPLLFQVVEESADATLKRTTVKWSYLKDNTWKSLDDRIVSDTTNGLVTSGIVHLGIPSDISKAKTTVLDPALYWIKASVTERSRAICEMINVHPQAAQVTFADEGNDPNHLAVPLAAGAIAKFEIPPTEIKTVAQPYNSFDGKLKEQRDHFYLRVSEQLRHKGRAVTVFDYERLVLEKFPEIYKVRCINHGALDEAQDQMYELVPGAITLAVVPDLSKRLSPNDLEPKVNINLLNRIKEYVEGLSSPWTTIQVVNPRYERIRIECRVKFKSPYDQNFGYYSRVLNQAITDFLAPWTRNLHAEIQFGGRLYYSAVVDFIEQQDSVDYIVEFTMSLDGQENIREAIASTPRSVLTSGPSALNQPYHTIREFKQEEIKDLPSQQLPQPDLLGYKALEDITL